MWNDSQRRSLVEIRIVEHVNSTELYIKYRKIRQQKHNYSYSSGSLLLKLFTYFTLCMFNLATYLRSLLCYFMLRLFLFIYSFACFFVLLRCSIFCLSTSYIYYFWQAFSAPFAEMLLSGNARFHFANEFAGLLVPSPLICLFAQMLPVDARDKTFQLITLFPWNY